jgi:hypothetical protein
MGVIVGWVAAGEGVTDGDAVGDGDGLDAGVGEGEMVGSAVGEGVGVAGSGLGERTGDRVAVAGGRVGGRLTGSVVAGSGLRSLQPVAAMRVTIVRAAVTSHSHFGIVEFSFVGCVFDSMGAWCLGGGSPSYIPRQPRDDL